MKREKALARPWLSLGVAVAAAALTAAGCGSTVSTNTQGLGASDVPGGMSNSLGSVSASSGPGAASRSLGHSTAVGTTGGLDAKSSQGIPGSPGNVGPGIVHGGGATDNTVKIGIHIFDQGSANLFLKAAGTGLALGDNRAAAQAIVNYINNHGGLAGRRIVPVYDQFDATSSDFAVQYQKACATFTQDNHVFAVVSHVNQEGWTTLATCLANARTPLVDSGIQEMVNQQEFAAAAPYLYGPSLLAGDRWEAVINQLASAEFFAAPGMKLGVVYTGDQPGTWAYQHVIVPALAAQHVAVASSATITPLNNESGASTNGNEMGQAVVRFRAAGVNHVLFAAAQAGDLFFSEAAENQGYRPRYALTSLDSPQAISSVAPAQQFHDALVTGWIPTLDVDTTQDPGGSPAAALCNHIISQAGVETPDRAAAVFFMSTCDGLFFLRAALSQSASLTVAGLRSGVDGLGTGYDSPRTFATHFVSGRYDGVGKLRLAKFDDGCGCFKYTAMTTTAP